MAKDGGRIPTTRLKGCYENDHPRKKYLQLVKIAYIDSVLFLSAAACAASRVTRSISSDVYQFSSPPLKYYSNIDTNAYIFDQTRCEVSQRYVLSKSIIHEEKKSIYMTSFTYM